MLLTGTEHTGGLAALRALRAAGYAPWAAVTSADAHGARSRAAAGVVRVPDARLDPAGFAQAVADCAARASARVVLPGTEGALLALAAHSERFGAGVALGVCSPAITVGATDKVTALAGAAELGIDVLSSRVLGVDNPSDTADVGYPVVVKPLRSELPVKGTLQRFEVKRVDDRNALELALAALPDGVGIVQEYVTGRLLTVNGVAWEGEVVAAVHKVGLRTWPAGCGVVSYAQTVAPDPVLADQARALIARMRWSGVFNLQFIDGQGGRFLIDVNPRLYTSLALAVAAGVNLPAIWVEALMGRRPAVPPYRVGVFFRSEDDVRSLAQQFRSGARRSAVAGLRPQRNTTHAVMSLSDPRPGLAYMRRIFGPDRAWQALKQLPSKLGRRLASSPRARRLLYELRNRRVFADLYQHDRMLADSVRTDVYWAAISKHVSEDDVVIDLGTGSGVLALFAARQGARVHAIEHGPIIEAAREVARDNGATGIEFHRTNSLRFELPDKVDAIVHEQIGDALFDERVVANIADLRDRLLKPGGRVYPHRLSLYIEPVQLQEHFRAPFAWQQELHGIGFGALERFAAIQGHGYLYRTFRPFPFDRFLCGPEPVVSIDLETANESDLPKRIAYERPVEREGLLDGFCVYFEARFDDEIAFTSSPADTPTSWGTPFLRVSPRRVAPGDSVRLELTADDLAHPSSWSWNWR